MDTSSYDFGEAHHALLHLRPNDPPPARTAPYDTRADWSERYVNWLIDQTPAEGPMPFDIDPSHRYQVEFFSCVMDPETYARRTAPEPAMADEALQ